MAQLVLDSEWISVAVRVEQLKYSALSPVLVSTRRSD